MFARLAAEKLIELMLVKFCKTTKPITFVNSDKDTLLEVVYQAGLNPRKVIPGVARTEDGVILNPNCPFKVVATDGSDDQFATGWLNELIQHVADKIHSDQNQVTEEVAEIIRNSVPFEPISLGDNGFLTEVPIPGKPFLIKRLTDNDTLDPIIIGRHSPCGFNIVPRKGTRGNTVLKCKRCRLVIVLSEVVKTYGDLRQVLSVPSSPEVKFL